MKKIDLNATDTVENLLYSLDDTSPEVIVNTLHGIMNFIENPTFRANLAASHLIEKLQSLLTRF